MSGSTIGGTVTVGLTLGSGSYQSPLTILSSGYVYPSSVGSTAIIVRSDGSILNDGTVIGGLDGGTGIYFDGSKLVNNGVIESGYGGGGGGYGVFLQSGSLLNNGQIVGQGHLGVWDVNATITNNGTIESENGGSAYAVLVSGGTLDNFGQIIDRTERSAAAVRQGTLNNYGTISPQNLQDGVQLGSQGHVINEGLITEIDAYNGGFVTNSGTILGGGQTGDAVYFGSGASRLIIEGSAIFEGNVVAEGQAKHQIMELASSNSSGILSGVGLTHPLIT